MFRWEPEGHNLHLSGSQVMVYYASSSCSISRIQSVHYSNLHGIIYRINFISVFTHFILSPGLILFHKSPSSSSSLLSRMFSSLNDLPFMRFPILVISFHYILEHENLSFNYFACHGFVSNMRFNKSNFFPFHLLI